jgi:hypothetical protein
MRAERTMRVARGVERADRCFPPQGTNYCDYFNVTGTSGSGGFGWPTCNAFTNEVGFLELNISAGVQFAFRRWFVYYDGSRWVSTTAKVQGVDAPGGDFRHGDTFDLAYPDFASYEYPQWVANDSRFVIWYEAWLWNGSQWLGPTWLRPTAYVLEGPYFGAGWTSNYSTICITEDPPQNVVTIGT